MAEWIEFTPGDLFPDEIATVVGTIGDAAGTLGGALEVAAAVVELAAQFVGGFADLQKALVEATQEAIQGVIATLLESGVYMLQHIPPSQAIRAAPKYWVRSVAASLNDTMDLNRPTLDDPGEYVGMVAIMATGPSYRLLMETYQKMFRLFGALLPTEEQLSALLEPTEEGIGSIPEPTFGTGQAPDWQSIKLADIIPLIGDIAGFLQGFQKWIEPAAAVGDVLSNFADLLRSKAAVLNELADTIDTLLKDLSEALEFSGTYVLPIYGQGDKQWLQRHICYSRGGPFDDESALYAAGFVFLASGPTSTPADILFEMFGLTTTTTSEIVAESESFYEDHIDLS